MIFLRSAAFNIAFYLNLVLWMIAALPLFLAPRRALIRLAQAWAHSSLFLLKILAGIRLEVRGRDKIPEGTLLVASKHQSLFETFALFTLFDDPAFILKRELMWIPLFGWLAWKTGMIPVDRGGGAGVLAALNRRCGEEIRRGRQILIFPEGTRKAPAAPPAYRQGAASLYTVLQVPCVMVALNSGVFWPRRRFLRLPGTIVIEIVDVLPPGWERQAFFQTLQTDIERASTRLMKT